MDEKRQAQRELFEEFVGTEKKRYPKDAFRSKERKDFKIRYEHILLIAIAFIVTAVIAFSLGVEKGKHLDKKPEVVKVDKPIAVPRLPESVKKPEKAIEETVASSFYTVQVASYRKEADALIEASRLQEKELESVVLEKGKYYVVCVGRFADSDAAKKLEKKLKKRYKDCYIRLIRP